MRELRAAAAAIRAAQRLVIAAGAGFGVDSGLPDFRGPEGFWRAYPPYRALGLDFADLASPGHFVDDPAFAWGFYGHRLQLYRDTRPHAGFALLREWCGGRPWFVVTSNVDGQFQRAGFDDARIYEIHGSIHHLQCRQPCSKQIWDNRERIDVDQASMRALDWPCCPRCGGVARPNILMFGDGAWVAARSDAQAARFERFLHESAGPTVVIELGAGTAVPSIRHLSEQLGRGADTTILRINPRQAAVAPPHLAIEQGALDALQAIAAELARD